MFDTSILNGMFGTFTKEDLDNYLSWGFMTQDGYNKALATITPAQSAAPQSANPAVQSNATNA